MKKYIIIIASTLFVLLTALEIYVQSDLFANKIRPSVAGPLAAALGPGAKIGKVKANLVPLFIEIRDISLVDARGRDTIAVRKVRVYVNPLALLIGQIRLSTITLLQPRIWAERTTGGELNLAKVVAQVRLYIENEKKQRPSRYEVILNSVDIRKGTIWFVDGNNSLQASATGIDIDAKVNMQVDSVRFVVKTPEVRIKADALPEIQFNLKTDGVYEHGKLRIGSFNLWTRDTQVNAEGAINAVPAGNLDLRITGRFGSQTLGLFGRILKAPKKQKGPQLEALLSIKGTIAEPILDGSIRIRGYTLGNIGIQDATVIFGYHNRSFTASGEQWKITKELKTSIINRLDAVFNYREAGIDIKRCGILAGDLSLGMTGRIDSASGLDATLSLESQNQGQMLTFLTNLPFQGRISVTGRATGPLSSPRFDGECSAGPLTVRGILFSRVDGRLRYIDKVLSLSDTSIYHQNSGYVFDGSMDFNEPEPLYTANLQVIHSDVVSIVSLFYKPLPLEMSATGELSFKGTGSDFTGTGRLSLEAGKAYGEAFDKGLITATLTRNKITFPQVVLYKGSGVVKATGWIGFDGTYAASLTSRYVSLSEVNILPGMPLDGQFKLDVISSGSFSQPKVKASLEMTDLIYLTNSIGVFTAGLEIQNGQMSVNATLPSGRVNFRSLMELHAPYPWTADLAVDADHIDPYLAFGNKESAARMQVMLDGKVVARGNGVNLSTCTATVSLRHLGLVIGDYRIDNEEEAVFTINGGTISVQSLKLKGVGTQMSVTGGSQLMKDMDFTIMGTANLSLLKIVYREVEHADGVAQVQLSIKDNWKNPEVGGTLNIVNGEVKIRDIPQKFSALNGMVTIEKQRIIVDSLYGEMGGGNMIMSGWAQLGGVGAGDFSAKASLDNVTVRYPPGLTSTLSGDLFFDGDGSEQNLSGDVRIKRARYDKRVEWKSMLVDLSRGFTQKKKTDIGWIGNTQINIRFHGADTIVFQNNLAKMPLSVDVFFRGTVNQPQLLGRLEAQKGTVYFRKNDFKILHASVDFSDPNRMNPMLDIQAETRVREYLIRLAVSGSADRAVVTLISDPSLPDQDILGLLALGKKSDELKGREAGVGMSEAASFATGQFQDIFERRARSLTGLDRVQVDPYVSKGDTSVPRVTVSKELIQDKLYVTYSSNVGATVPEQDFRIEYILDKHFSLVGERNEIGNIGADMKFRFEFK